MAIAGEICIYTNANIVGGRAVSGLSTLPETTQTLGRHADAAADRRRAGQVRHRAGGGQARGRDRAAQPHAAPEARAGAGRGDRAEEHPDDRPDRRRQDRDRAPARAARAVAVPEGRGVEVHRGRLRRPRRRVDGPRSGGARRRHGAGGAARGGAREGGAERRGAAARHPAAAGAADRARRGAGRAATRSTRRASASASSSAPAGSTPRRRNRRAGEVVPVVRDHRRVVGRGSGHQPEGHAARAVPGQDEEAAS